MGDWVKENRVLVGSVVLNVALLVSWAVAFAGARDAGSAASELRRSFELSEVALGRARSRIAELERAESALGRDLAAAERELEDALSREQAFAAGLAQQGSDIDGVIERNQRIAELVATAEGLVRAGGGGAP